MSELLETYHDGDERDALRGSALRGRREIDAASERRRIPTRRGGERRAARRRERRGGGGRERRGGRIRGRRGREGLSGGRGGVKEHCGTIMNGGENGSMMRELMES